MTTFFTYYGQKCMVPYLKEQADLGAKFAIIDDGSPEPLEKVEGIECYRINEDIKWNQTGAKNLGFHVLDGWIMHCPIDMRLSAEGFKALDQIDKQIGTVYYIAYANSTRVVPICEGAHDIFIMHKSDFEKSGGFDEDLSGHYGWEDLLFHSVCLTYFKTADIDSVHVVHEPKGQTVGLARDPTETQKLFLHKLHRLAAGKMETTPKLRFTWRKL